MRWIATSTFLLASISMVSPVLAQDAGHQLLQSLTGNNDNRAYEQGRQDELRQQRLDHQERRQEHDQRYGQRYSDPDRGN